MEAQEIYTIREIIILVILTAIGTGAFLGYALVSKKMSLNLLLAFYVFLGNLFVVSVLIELSRLKGYYEYHYIIALVGSYMGMYILEYVDKKRAFNIFDSMIKKVGLDTGNNENIDKQN